MVYDFLYLDNELLRSLLSQFNEGLAESVSQQAEHTSSIDGGAKANIPLVAELGTNAKYAFSRSNTETKSAHHFAFIQLNRHLESNKLIGKQGEKKSFISLSGSIRFIDGAKIAEDMNKLPSLIKGLEAVMAFSDQTSDVDEMGQIADNAPAIGELISSLTGGNLLAKIGGEYIYLDREFIHSQYAPELKSSGTVFEGSYTLIGIPSKSIPEDADTDPIIDIVNALSQIETSMLQVSHIKPLAIYKTLS